MATTSGPITTLFPISSLPSCVTNCGSMFDVNGECVPPVATVAAPDVYGSCFCSDTRLTAFSSTTAGVCDSACTATPADLGSIQSWYSSYCLNIDGVVATPSSGGSSSSSSGGNSTWISTHWQWVLFLILMVLFIAGSWLGAAQWRKRYLARKDRRLQLQGPATPQAPGTGGSDSPFTANAANAATEKPSRRWWKSKG